MRWADIEVPNDAVDMDSWASSACYPQRTFYPLIDNLSIQYYRVTMTDILIIPVWHVRLTVKQVYAITLKK